MPLQRTRVALTGRAAELLPLLERLEALAPAHSLAVAAVATQDQRDPALRAALGRLSPAPEVYLRTEEALASVGTDVFLVASSLVQRHAHVRAALASGCHVLAAAPLALTVRAAAGCVTAAEDAGRALAVYGSGRFSLDVHMLKWAAGSGIIGDPTYVLDIAFGAEETSPNLCARGDPALHERLRGGGLLLVRAVGDCALLRFAVNDIVEVSGHEACLEPERIARGPDGRVRARFACSAADTIAAQFRFANGAAGVYTRSWAGRGTTLPPRRTVWATRGAVDDDSLFLHTGARRSLQEEWKAHLTPVELERLFPGAVTDSLTLELLSFLTSVARWDSGPKTAMPHHGGQALRDLATAWAIAESNTTGRRMTVQEVESLAAEEAQRDLNAHIKAL